VVSWNSVRTGKSPIALMRNVPVALILPGVKASLLMSIIRFKAKRRLRSSVISALNISRICVRVRLPSDITNICLSRWARPKSRLSIALRPLSVLTSDISSASSLNQYHIDARCKFDDSTQIDSCIFGATTPKSNAKEDTPPCLRQCRPACCVSSRTPQRLQLRHRCGHPSLW
jgi:hypothetical protein